MTTIRYKDAGVNIDAGHAFVKEIAARARSASRPEVLGGIGGFGGLFRFDASRYREPVLVSGTDGVGTKLTIAAAMNRYDTIGIDLVAMCVNDIVVLGAEPLFFLDYLAVNALDRARDTAMIDGIVEGCRQAGCALVGGETAEMPAVYSPGGYDMAGFVVGVVEHSQLIDGQRIEPGDVLVGLASSGLHSNGYSLARRVLFDAVGLAASSLIPGYDQPLGEILLKPTRIYARSVLALISEGDVRGIAHVTGGGLTENLPRILPEGCQARIRRGSWNVPPIFRHIQNSGTLDDDEMYRVFNMGIGLVLVTSPAHADRLVASSATLGEQAMVIGDVIGGRRGVQYVEA